jgi:hypothetical protein
MALQLIRLDAYPNDIAVTKTPASCSGGAFFLDFTRPLERHRWFGVHNKSIGPTVGLFVPVVHESEHDGGLVISVRRGDPYFTDIQALWKARCPSKRSAQPLKADSLQVVADFAAQFPEDSR